MAKLFFKPEPKASKNIVYPPPPGINISDKMNSIEEFEKECGNRWRQVLGYNIIPIIEAPRYPAINFIKNKSKATLQP